MLTIIQFLRLEKIHDLSNHERFIAILWWYHKNTVERVEFKQLKLDNTFSGYPQINASYVKGKLKKDNRTFYVNGGKFFSLKISEIKTLDAEYLSLLGNIPLPESSVIFSEIDFANTRGYLIKVIKQINVSYEISLYDCCAVMLRRLLETLIIDIYEAIGRSDELRGSDGHFMMFSSLLSVLENDQTLNIGRQTIKCLKEFKKIADSSAHNRRFNASKKNIDDELNGIKLAVVELRQLAYNC